MMVDSVQDFYDRLAEDYHLIFADWEQSVARQGEILDKFIREHSTDAASTILDCSCGIGTQSIGLAQRGYKVYGTDLSPKAVERARQYAHDMDVDVEFAVSDFRQLSKNIDGQFDVVISCDNSLAHLLTDDDLSSAVQNMISKLNTKGILLISIRDYDELLKQKPKSDPIRIFDKGDGRRITFQVWDWDDELPVYTVNHFILTQGDMNNWQTTHRQTKYRALQRSELSQILVDSGLVNMKWYMPNESGYYQPIVTAYKG